MRNIFGRTDELLEELIDEVQGIREILERAFPEVQVSIVFGNNKTGRLTMTDLQSQTASLEIDDAAGFPVGGTPDAPPAWSEDSSGKVVTLTPAADGMTCVIKAVAPGTSNLTCALAIGGKPFTGTAQVLITASAATAVKIVLGAPTP